MNSFYVFIYFTFFSIIAGSAFAMMWGNIRSINEQWDKPKPRHPEAPQPGEEIMYVDVSHQNADEFQETKNKLEDLYNA